MDKCREAFERHQANLTTTDYEALKAHFDSNEKYSGSRYNEGSLYERDWLVWEACWQSRQAEIDQLSTQNELLKKIAEDDMAKIERLESVINQNDAELKEKDKRIKELKDSVATYKIETYESHGRISYAHHCFMNMDRDQFYKNIEAVICGRLRHPEFSFDRSRIKALRGDNA